MHKSSFGSWCRFARPSFAFLVIDCAAVGHPCASSYLVDYRGFDIVDAIGRSERRRSSARITWFRVWPEDSRSCLPADKKATLRRDDPEQDPVSYTHLTLPTNR